MLFRILILALVPSLFACGPQANLPSDPSLPVEESPAPPSSPSPTPPICGTGCVLLTWDAPTTNEDGTPVAHFEGDYTVYLGIASGQYTQTIPLKAPGSLVQYVVTGLISGQTYCFVVTTTNTLNNESAYSNEVCKTPQ